MASVTPIEDLRLSETAALFEGRDEIPDLDLRHGVPARAGARTSTSTPTPRRSSSSTARAVFTAGDEELIVPGGNIVVVPAETPHGFKNHDDDDTLRVVSIHPNPVVEQTNL